MGGAVPAMEETFAQLAGFMAMETGAS